MVAGLRILRSRLPTGDPALEALIARLRACDQQFATWWDEAIEVDARSLVDKDYQHPEVGLLRLRQIMTTGLDPVGVMILHLLPRDAATAAKLCQLVACPNTADGQSVAVASGPHDAIVHLARPSP